MAKDPALPIVTKVVELSPLDQTGPRNCVHKFFCFPFPDADREAEAVDHLRQCLSTTVSRWPFITGEIGPALSSAPAEDLLELRYPATITQDTIVHVLRVKTMTMEEFPWTYQQLADRGMPPSAMNMDVLSTVPEWPKAGEMYPALAIQANFIHGGLILCFAFHHAVADGTSFTTFIKQFATGAKTGSPRPDSIIEADISVAPRIGYRLLAAEEEFPSLYDFPEYNHRTTLPEPARSPVAVTTRILVFPSSTIEKLEIAVNKYLKVQVGFHAWASVIGCLSSLIWVAVVRARQQRLDKTDIAKMGVAVDIRSVVKPSLGKEYFGNAIVHTHATAKISDLLDDNDSADFDGVISCIPVSTVALAAWRIRQAVEGVNAKYVDDRLKMLSNLDDPLEATRAYDRTMDNRNTGIDFSSWREQGADLEFDIPGTATSAVDYWRKAWSPNEGAYNILPRKGGGKGPANWEVSLGLSVEDMEKVCSTQELGAWTSQVIE